MNTHFDKYLNTRELLLKRKPQNIVEFGVGSGDNSIKILGLKDEFPFMLHMINDSQQPNTFNGIDHKFYEWIPGLSYKKVKEFPDEFIDFLFIDSDHNYWTMKQELNESDSKLNDGAIICIHDTESYDKKNGYAYHYGTGEPYGMEIFEDGGGMGNAIREFLSSRPNYHVIRESKESQGAIAIEKRGKNGFQ